MSGTLSALRLAVALFAATPTIALAGFAPAVRMGVSGQTVNLGTEETAFSVSYVGVDSPSPGSVEIQSVDLDVYMDPRATIGARGDGSPDCLGLVPNTSFEFLPLGCSGSECERMTVSASIPTGGSRPTVLFSCRAHVPTDVGGSYVIRVDVVDALSIFFEHFTGPTQLGALHVRDGAPVALTLPSTTLVAGRGGTVELHLQTHGFPVAGVAVDIALPDTMVFGTDNNDRPACTVDPDILKFASLAFLPAGQPSLSQVRLLLLSLENSFPIRDGRLITCAIFEFNNSPGTYRINLENPSFSTPDGEAILGVGGFGTVVVTNPAQPTSTITRTRVPTATVTRPPTITATPTVRATTPATATRTPTGEVLTGCVGDCGGNGRVTIDELVRGVAIALERTALDECPSFDGNGDGRVAVNELIAAVKIALGAGCSAAAELTLSAPSLAVSPLETMRLTVGPSGAGASSALLVDMDLVGHGAFSASDTVSVRPLAAGDTLLVAAPLREFFPASTGAVAVRVRRESDGAISNTLLVNVAEVRIPSTLRGYPATLLGLTLKALFSESDSVLTTAAADLRPGALADAARRLDAPGGIADAQAEAILRQIFGFSVVNDASVQLNGGLVEPVKESFRRMLGCVADRIGSFDASFQGAGDDCFDFVRREIRDNVIPGLTNINTTVSSVAGTITSLMGRGIQNVVGGYVERWAVSAEMAEWAGSLSQFALSLPPFGSGEETVDFVGDQLTAYGKRKLYDALTTDLGEADRFILDNVGGPEAVDAVVGLVADQVEALQNVETSLFGVNSVTDRLENLAGVLGGSDPAEPPGDIPGVGLPPIDIEPGDTPTELCAKNPQFSAAVDVLGFPSCESYLAPFLDEMFLTTTIMPLLDQLVTLVQSSELQACLASPDEPGCDAVISRFSALVDQLLGTLRGYDAGDFHCDGGYAEYDANAETRTCLHNSLVYAPSGGCFAGSRSAPYDTGGTAVCMYYSRDYVRDGSCLDNYQKVFFLGAERCRWAALPLSSPAAYSINRATGDRVVLEP